jgi:hypothetical protein
LSEQRRIIAQSLVIDHISISMAGAARVSGGKFSGKGLFPLPNAGIADRMRPHFCF